MKLTTVIRNSKLVKLILRSPNIIFQVFTVEFLLSYVEVEELGRSKTKKLYNLKHII